MFCCRQLIELIGKSSHRAEMRWTACFMVGFWSHTEDAVVLPQSCRGFRCDEADLAQAQDRIWAWGLWVLPPWLADHSLVQRMEQVARIRLNKSPPNILFKKRDRFSKGLHYLLLTWPESAFELSKSRLLWCCDVESLWFKCAWGHKLLDWNWLLPVRLWHLRQIVLRHVCLAWLTAFTVQQPHIFICRSCCVG